MKLILITLGVATAASVFGALLAVGTLTGIGVVSYYNREEAARTARVRFGLEQSSACQHVYVRGFGLREGDYTRVTAHVSNQSKFPLELTLNAKVSDREGHPLGSETTIADMLPGDTDTQIVVAAKVDLDYPRPNVDIDVLKCRIAR